MKRPPADGGAPAAEGTGTPLRRDVIRRYDRVIYTPIFEAYYEGSGFANFGYWEKDTASQKEACENLMERLLGLLPERRGRILDVACGKGATTRHLLRDWRPAEVVAVNLSARQLRSARAAAPGCGFVLADAAGLAFADRSFDVVQCVEAAFHFETRERFLREALRVLRPGGRLILSDILMNEDAERRRDLRSVANYLADPAAYRDLLARIGFHETRVLDVTEECWRRYYWHGVRYFHDQYLRRAIDLPTLRTYLEAGYRRVYDLEYYVLASARRPAGGGADR